MVGQWMVSLQVSTYEKKIERKSAAYPGDTIV
jgi:hypothetical protein